MVTTRSKTSQTHLEDYATKEGAAPRTAKSKGRSSPSRKQSSKADTSKPSPKHKRKDSVVDDAPSKEPKSKRAKTSQSSPKRSISTGTGQNDPKVIINRAPVLQLWGASVTHLIYPSLSWETCLSAGSAISTLCAISKGRSIGTISERDNSEEKQRKRDEAKKKQEYLNVIEVMHFKLKLKDGLALVGSELKGKPGSEAPLKKKFGDEQYEEVRQAFEMALENWKGDEDELNKEAFGFYERFRPDVSKEQKGWGKKGELSLEKVRSVVAK
ncbi:hypothetical protein K469DRAFT_706490 [Zopfia rhizophila CBS 207.26]|uniref:Uncharacterized protein n=1 Tax=Zopfia rhizophila CBS 207.26 TaxID=1314779 RepID=A0A6A6E6W5_9PEZI|nr:hypothetical protein K469DRAFT_706490 [Zopfia rhizophila CBS 207.26]